jgi:hypothetical protein
VGAGRPLHGVPSTSAGSRIEADVARSSGRADEVVELVDEQDDVAALSDLLDHLRASDDAGLRQRASLRIGRT